jgi:hypothetical protein
MVKIALTSQLKALIMDRPKITFGNNGSLVPNEKGNYFVKGKILDNEKANFTNWVIIYEKDLQFAEDVETALYNAGETIGVAFDYAKKIEMPNKKREAIDIKNAVDKAAKLNPQIIVLIADSFTQKKGYSVFKQCCRQQHGLQSQVIKMDKFHF